jgi:hypothetical protein
VTCCDHCQDARNLFDESKARKELRQYRKDGPPNESTRLLIDALKTLDLQDRTLLDVGGGVGVIPLEELVEASMAKATRWYGVTYPKERWYNQVLGSVAGVYCWARDMDFRMHVHTGVEDAIRANGFEPFYEVTTILWRVELYERNGAA